MIIGSRPQSAHLVLVAVSAVHLMLAGCAFEMAGSGSEAGNSDARVAKSYFIDLPSSVSQPPAQALGKKSASASVPSSALELYDGVREYIGLADALVHNTEFGVVTIIDQWHNSLDWNAIKALGSWTHRENGFAFTASFDPTREFAYRLLIEQDTTDTPTVFFLNYNGDSRAPNGQVFVNLGLIDSATTNGATYSVAFGTSPTGRTLDIKLGVANVSPFEDDAIGSLRLLLSEREGVIHLSGCSYHPNIDGILPDTIGHCYIFTGTADTLADKSIIHLGLPPARYARNDSSLFTTYGLSRMFTKAIINQELDALDDTTKMVVVTSYTDSLTIEEIFDSILVAGSAEFLSPPESLATITVEQFEYFLELNASIGDSADQKEFAELLWVLKLEQPVYFTTSGYAGNGTVVPTGFGYLAEVPPSLSPLVPREIRDLTVP